MSNIISDCYQPLLEDRGFSVQSEHPYNSAGMCWSLSPEIGEGYYWVYAQKDLFDIKIHDFFFHQDSLMEFDMPKCLSITQYESISGKEFHPYRRLSSGCIKTFIGGSHSYKVFIHKKIPVQSIGIEIMPAYYEQYLKEQYPEDYANPLSAFQTIDQTMNFPEMAKLLYEVQNYRGEGIAANLFYEAKVAEAVSLIVRKYQKGSYIERKRLTPQDIMQLENVTAYLDEHYAYDIPLEHLAKIACMGTTKFKTSFKQLYECTVTEYIQKKRMEQAEHLLTNTDMTIGQIAQTVGYSTSSRFAKLFRKSTGLLPGEYRKILLK